MKTFLNLTEGFYVSLIKSYLEFLISRHRGAGCPSCLDQVVTDKVASLPVVSASYFQGQP